MPYAITTPEHGTAFDIAGKGIAKTKATEEAIRIAAGCGLEVVDVNRLLKSFEMLQQMTKAMTKGGGMRGLGGMMGGFGGKVAKGAMHGFGRKKRLK